MLSQAKASPDINNYLTYLSITQSNPTGLSKEAWHAARTAGAIMLKNNVKSNYKSMPEQSKAYIKSNILNGLSDPTGQIRNYVGNVITEIVKKGGVQGWQEVIPQLITIIEQTAGQASPEAQDGAMGALFKICEDNKKALDQEHNSQRPLTFLLPKLLQFMTSSNFKIQIKAISTINVFLTDPWRSQLVNTSTTFSRE